MPGARGNFDDILASAPPALRPICRSLRRTIAALDADFTEIVWPRQRIASFGIGPRKMSEHYAYIAVYAKHVNLGFYHGTVLTDRKSLLQGDGAKLRHISFRDLASVRRPGVAALLREAIQERRQHAGTPGTVARGARGRAPTAGR